LNVARILASFVASLRTQLSGRFGFVHFRVGSGPLATTWSAPLWAFARSSRASADAGSIDLSSAATPASLCSVLSATFSSSAGSEMRATASSAVCGSAAWRATLPSAFASCTRPSAAARTVSCGEDFATVENCRGSRAATPRGVGIGSASDRDADETGP
jgi:hypothetical protein